MGMFRHGVLCTWHLMLLTVQLQRPWLAVSEPFLSSVQMALENAPLILYVGDSIIGTGRCFSFLGGFIGYYDECIDVYCYRMSYMQCRFSFLKIVK